jgi:hypothetical protein
MSPYLMKELQWVAHTRTEHVTTAQAGHTANCQV